MFRNVELKMDEQQAVTFELFFYISESPKGHLNLKCIGSGIVQCSLNLR